MIKSKTKLPDKLSELILVALEDLAKVKVDPRYEIDLSSWHTSQEYTISGKCSVCFAGAVMAGRMAPDRIGESIDPHDFEPSDARKLRALNELRTGSLLDAMLEMDLEEISLSDAPGIGLYSEYDFIDPDAYASFRAGMRATSSWLAERGL